MSSAWCAGTCWSFCRCRPCHSWTHANRLERRDFISVHTTGFEQVAESAGAWDPRTVAEKTGVPPESIERAARLFAKADRAIVLHARGVEHQSKGVGNCLALINLCLATGNIGREGACNSSSHSSAG